MQAPGAAADDQCVARPSFHLLAPLAVAAASLALPFASPGKPAPTIGKTASVQMKVEQLGDGRPADQQFPIDGPAVQVARQVANAHWSANPCNGAVEFTWVTTDPTTNATASWRNPSDAWNNIGENFDCRIELNTAAEFDFAKLCTVVTHEVGHLVGQQHAEQPGLLMSPYYSDPLQACVDANPNAPAPVAQASSDGMENIEFDLAARKKAQAAAAKKAAAKKAAAKRKAAAAKKRTLNKKRCVVRFKAGKRVKRCAKAATAKRATTTRRAKRA